jgi:hypothetical protein
MALRAASSAVLGAAALVVGLAAPVQAVEAQPAERAAARPAGSAHLSGTVTFEQLARPEYPSGAGASWSLDGDTLYLLQEASVLGIADTAGWSDTDEKYAHATLTGAHVPVQAFPCGDAGGPTTTRDYPAVVDPDAAFGITAVRVDQLTGKGSIQVNLAESQTSPYEMLAPGTVALHEHSDCSDPATDTTVPVSVMGEGGAPISSWWPLGEGRGYAWKLVRDHAGDWVVNATKTYGDEPYDQATETVHLNLTGSLPSLRAQCALPSVRKLRPLTSFRRADAMVAKAGFDHVVHQSKPSRAAPKGHFFITEGIGNTYAECGQRHLHIVRSLGWP